MPYGGDEAYCDYVYNIEVADSNTYFVTEMGILVDCYMKESIYRIQ
ncbi:hypothetical protein DCO44_02145 [Acinetobacter sp. AM]|nr:hypothetical protein DCO44_02145 [Acinetobacter sp. AM]